MNPKTIVNYVTYVVGAVAVYALLKVAVLPVVVLGACVAAQLLYVRK